MMNVYQIAPLEERLSDSYWQSRFTMALLVIFAGLALLLATAGVYGVMSYLAAQRTQEIGIRIAIGASASDVVWLVTSQGLRAAAAGLAAGIAGYLAISRLLAGQLFGVSATDPVTLLVAAVGLMLVCTAASAVPGFAPSVSIHCAHCARMDEFRKDAAPSRAGAMGPAACAVPLRYRPDMRRGSRTARHSAHG